MKKIIISLICLLSVTGSAFAQVDLFKENSNSTINEGIIDYKSGNYIGCMQKMNLLIEEDPANALAHYYLAITYVKMGNKDNAIKEYNNVLDLNSNSTLTNYAETGLVCIQTPEKCTIEEENKFEEWKEIKENIGNLINPVSEKVEEEIKVRKLETIKNIINSGGEVDPKMYEELDDFSKKKSSKGQPTNEEIATALNVLSRAGITLNGAQLSNNQSNNPEMMQMQMLMSSMGSGMSNPMAMNNNNMMNMLPYMMQQNTSGSQKMNPELMQTMITGMMMPNMYSSMGQDNRY